MRERQTTQEEPSQYVMHQTNSIQVLRESPIARMIYRFKVGDRVHHQIGNRDEEPKWQRDFTLYDYQLYK